MRVPVLSKHIILILPFSIILDRLLLLTPCFLNLLWEKAAATFMQVGSCGGTAITKAIRTSLRYLLWNQGSLVRIRNRRVSVTTTRINWTNQHNLQLRTRKEKPAFQIPRGYSLGILLFWGFGPYSYWSLSVLPAFLFPIPYELDANCYCIG